MPGIPTKLNLQGGEPSERQADARRSRARKAPARRPAQSAMRFMLPRLQPLAFVVERIRSRSAPTSDRGRQPRRRCSKRRRLGLQRAASKIGMPEDINAFMGGSVGQRFRQAALDDLYGILRAEKTLFGEQVGDGPYETARLTRSAHAIVLGATKYGPPKRFSDGRWTFVDRDGQPFVTIDAGNRVRRNPNYRPWGLIEILKPVRRNLQAFGAYAIGRRAAFLNRYVREGGVLTLAFYICFQIVSSVSPSTNKSAASLILLIYSAFCIS